MAPGARTARAQAAVAGVLGTRSWGRRGRGQRPRRDSRAPGGRPRDQGGDPAPQAGANRARRDPEGGSGVLGRRKLVPGRLGSRLVLSTPVASSQGRPREGRISGAAAEAPGGRGGGGGRLARRLGERPGGPGLGPPQPPPLAAGGTRSGRDRRGRKLSDLRGENIKTNGRQAPVPARLSPRPSQPTPTKPRDWPRPRPTSLRTGSGDWEPGRHDGSTFPCRRRLSLPCQRQPP